MLAREIGYELRHTLDAYVVLGATAPRTVLNNAERDLPALCSVIGYALAGA